MSSTATYGVTGLTCAHCVSAVREEIGELPGVHEVSIDLVVGGTSIVSVTSDAVLGEAQVRAAVDEAGYELADRTP